MHMRSIISVGLVISAVFVVAAEGDQCIDPKEALLEAIKSDSSDSVKRVILSNLGQKAETNESLYALLKGIMTSATDSIQKVVKPLVEDGKDDKAPLIWAILLKRANAVRALIECGAQVTTTMVEFAADMGDVKTALEIVRSAIGLGDLTERYMSVAIKSLSGTDQEIGLTLMQELIKQDYDPNKVWSYHQIYSYAHIIDFLLKQGANPNYQEPEVTSEEQPEKQLSPLLRAVAYGRKIVEYLLAAGANINENADDEARQKGLRTPLALAIKHGNADVVELLLQRGASL